jgi:hypothetical protein
MKNAYCIRNLYAVTAIHYKNEKEMMKNGKIN